MFVMFHSYKTFSIKSKSRLIKLPKFIKISIDIVSVVFSEGSLNEITKRYLKYRE